MYSLEKNLQNYQEICEQLNAEYESFQNNHDERIKRLNRNHVIWKVAKILSIILMFFAFGLIVFFLARYMLVRTENEIADEMEYYGRKQEKFRQRYLQEVYHPMIAQEFCEGKFLKDMLRKELTDEMYFEEFYGSQEYLGGVSGKVDGIRFEENAIRLYGEKLDGGQKDYFKGTVLALENPKPCEEPVMITNKYQGGLLSTSNTYRINVDNEEFREQCHVECADSIDAFRILTPYYMEKLLSFMKSGIADNLVFHKDRVFIFIKHKQVNYYCNPYYPYSAESCMSNIGPNNLEVMKMVKEIHQEVIENMR